MKNKFDITSLFEFSMIISTFDNPIEIKEINFINDNVSSLLDLYNFVNNQITFIIDHRPEELNSFDIDIYPQYAEMIYKYNLYSAFSEYLYNILKPVSIKNRYLFDSSHPEYQNSYGYIFNLDIFNI